MQNNAQTTPAGQPPEAAPPKPAKRPPPPPPPPEFRAGAILKMDQAALIRLLQDPAATTFPKAKACQRLAVISTKDAVPALAALLADPHLSAYARTGLESIDDPSADDALRQALAGGKGPLLVGVINSIGHRRDARSVDALARLLHGGDAEAAQAAATALGRISGPAAAKALQEALGRTGGAVRAAVARACLVCAEGLLARGAHNDALSLYGLLTGTDVPKPVRLAAMHGIIAAETSLNRPR